LEREPYLQARKTAQIRECNSSSLGRLERRDNSFMDASGNHDQKQGESDHQSGQRVDGGNRSPADGSFHIDGQGVEAPSGCEEGDDEVIDGEGEGKQSRGNNPGQHQRQFDLKKDGGRLGSQVHGGFHQGIVEALQACLDHDNGVGHAESDMGDQHGEHAGIDPGEVEEQSQGHAHKDVGYYQRHIDEGKQMVSAFEVLVLQSQRREHPDQGGYEGGQPGDQHGVLESFDDVVVLQQLLIILEGEAFPGGDYFRIVETEDNQDRDGDVEKDYHESEQGEVHPFVKPGDA